MPRYAQHNESSASSKTPISLVRAGMGVTSMMGFAADEVSVAVTVRTMPVSAASCPCVCRWVPVVRAWNAEPLAVERNDAERQLIGLECLSAMCFAHQSVERRAKLVWLDRTQRIAQRRVGQSPPNTQQPPRRLAHPLAQILDLGEALGARDHGSEGRAQQRPEPPVPLRVSRSASFAPVVAGVVNFVETELIESFREHAEKPPIHACCHRCLPFLIAALGGAEHCRPKPCAALVCGLFRLGNRTRSRAPTEREAFLCFAQSSASRGPRTNQRTRRLRMFLVRVPRATTA